MIQRIDVRKQKSDWVLHISKHTIYFMSSVFWPLISDICLLLTFDDLNVN